MLRISVFPAKMLLTFSDILDLLNLHNELCHWTATEHFQGSKNYFLHIDSFATEEKKELDRIHTNCFLNSPQPLIFTLSN